MPLEIQKFEQLKSKILSINHKVIIKMLYKIHSSSYQIHNLFVVI